MEHANLQLGNKETGKTIFIVDKEEGQRIVAAIEDYAKKHPRSKKAAKLLKEFNELAVY